MNIWQLSALMTTKIDSQLWLTTLQYLHYRNIFPLIHKAYTGTNVYNVIPNTTATINNVVVNVQKTSCNMLLYMQCRLCAQCPTLLNYNNISQ